MANYTIISSTPGNGTTGILLDSFFEIVTSVQLKPQTINSTTISIYDTGHNRLEGSFSYSNHSNGKYGIIGFSPTAPLRALMTYTIVISSVLGSQDESLVSPAIISFTAGEILTRTLKTSDNITFFERICYPQDGQNILSFSQYNGNGQIESRNVEKKINPQQFPIVSQVISGGGTITPLGTFFQQVGSAKSFTAEAGEGFRLAHLYIDGYPNAVAESNAEYTFTNIMKSHSISALFLGSPSLMINGQDTLSHIVINQFKRDSYGDFVRIENFEIKAQAENALSEEALNWDMSWSGDTNDYMISQSIVDKTMFSVIFPGFLPAGDLDIRVDILGVTYIANINIRDQRTIS